MLMTKKGQGSSYHYLKAKCLGEIMECRAKNAPGKQWVNFFEVNQTRNNHGITLTRVDINYFAEHHRIS